jgi:membrane-anchored glycerophosphoryl diester phosphodiesterase (GDPDase)
VVSLLATDGEIIPSAVVKVDWGNLSTIQIVSLSLIMIFSFPIFVRLIFSPLLIAEGKDFLEAMRESWFITHGLQLVLFGFSILLALLAVSGGIAVGVGVLFTLPLAQCAFAALFNAVKTHMLQ